MINNDCLIFKKSMLQLLNNCIENWLHFLGIKQDTDRKLGLVIHLLLNS